MVAFLKEHQVTKDFLQSHFKEHSKFYPKLVFLLFETFVLRTKLVQLQTVADSATTAVRAATTSAGNVKAQVGQLDT